MEPQKDLKTLIGDALNQKNLNLDKFSQVANIPKRYLEAIQNVDIAKLPAAPYVQGYLKKIAGALHLNYPELWSLYEKELSHKTSGAFDKLPVNRFSIQSLRKKGAVAAIIGLLVVAYLILNFSRLSGIPPLEIIYPAETATAVFEPVIFLEGKFDPKDKLLVNGEERLGSGDGAFRIPFNLQPGSNAVEFKVKRFLGRETTVLRQVLYEPKL